jgi:predicted DNA-binding transcriptional regulator YafY
MYDVKICEAIRGLVLLQITYDGTIRLVEPHAYGHDKAGHELLRAWQTQPAPEDWRSFQIDKATSIAITNTRFSGPRLGYMRNDKQMDRIYCQL